jgi:D-3-phosphoglycerate dehydrogenase / 2-oxoglutarate reductase
MKVLIHGDLDAIAEKILREHNIEFDVKKKLTSAELKEIIGKYDGIVNYSLMKFDKDILNSAIKLKAIALASIGFDHIDIAFCKDKGIAVMNSPLDNAVSTAEHTIALLMAVTRHIPFADTTTKQGNWFKNKCVGVELTGKTLGVVGCGNIGSRVAERGLGLKMKVISFDPFLTKEKAEKLGIESVSLDELYERSDFITFNVPLIPATKGMLNKDAIAKMKDGVYIINAARGGIMNEQDICDAVENGKISGFATDVYKVEPPKESPLFKYNNIICTPHIGAGTREARFNAAQTAATELAEYLLKGKERNRVN